MLDTLWLWLATWLGFDRSGALARPGAPDSPDFGSDPSPPGPPPR